MNLNFLSRVTIKLCCTRSNLVGSRNVSLWLILKFWRFVSFLVKKKQSLFFESSRSFLSRDIFDVWLVLNLHEHARLIWGRSCDKHLLVLLLLLINKVMKSKRKLNYLDKTRAWNVTEMGNFLFVSLLNSKFNINRRHRLVNICWMFWAKFLFS